MVLTISYDLPESLTLTKDFQEYGLYWQKQAGTHDDSYEFIFNKPFGTEYEVVSSELKHQGEAIVTEGLLNSDKEFYVKLH